MSLRRNLLLILARGLRSDALDDARAWPVQTPNFCALSKQGMRLVAISACPADPGGRLSLLTGRHARQHGQLNDRDTSQPTRPKLQQPKASELPLGDTVLHHLKEAGYYLAGVGQVSAMRPWLDRATVVADLDELNPTRCDYWRTMLNDGVAPVLVEQRKARLRAGPFEPDRLMLEVEQDPDGFIGAAAARQIAELPTDRPWAMVVVFTGPGNDLPPPTLYDGLVEPRKLSGGYAPADLTKLNALAEPAYPRVMLQRLEPWMMRNIRSDYLSRVSMLDRCVGELIKATQNRPDRGRAWTVLSSDRGHLLGEHGLVGRRSFLAGAVETPLIVAASRFTEEKTIEPREVEEGLFSTVDIAPTIAALAGCDLSRETAGRSLLPLLQNEPVLPEHPGQACISEFNDRLMLQTDRYKAVFDRLSRTCLGLFDLVADPEEHINLLEREEGKNTLDSLRWRLADALLPLRA